MPQPPTVDRLTAGERRLADVIDSPTAPKASRTGETTAARPQVDLVWDVDPEGHSAAGTD